MRNSLGQYTRKPAAAAPTFNSATAAVAVCRRWNLYGRKSDRRNVRRRERAAELRRAHVLKIQASEHGYENPQDYVDAVRGIRRKKPRIDWSGMGDS